MPKHPSPSAHADAVSANPFGDLAPIMAKKRAAGQLYEFHLGDSFLMPAEAARRIDLDRAQIHRYCPVPGLPEFRAQVSRWVSAQLNLSYGEESAFATPGCTGACSILTSSLFDPGDEVLVVTPVWPLILGILSARGVVPVEVPISYSGWPEADGDDFRRRLREACTERTAGIYLCDPNNPAGFVTPEAQMRAVREVAEEHQLWMVVDVVYKDLILDDTQWHVPLLAESGGADRLVLAGSFSKSHVLAGHRAGFILAPEQVHGIITRVITHAPYHASTSAQEMAVAALGAGPPEIERIRRSYATGREVASNTLELRHSHPQAGAFLFIDLGELVDEAHTMDLLRACLDAGVSLAPGSAFGADFKNFARLCYTASPPEVVREGIEVLNPVLARQVQLGTRPER